MKYLQSAAYRPGGATWRRAPAVALVAVALVALAACSGSSSPSASAAAASAAAASAPAGSAPASAPAASKFDVTLKLNTYEDATNFPNFKAALDACTAATGVKVNVENLPGSGAAIYPGKVRTELVGGSGPDIWRIWGGSLGGPFATGGFALDISPYISKYGWDKLVPQAAI